MIKLGFFYSPEEIDANFAEGLGADPIVVNISSDEDNQTEGLCCDLIIIFESAIDNDHFSCD